MRLKDIIFVPSVQHTGTWFVINFIKHFVPRSKELTFLLEEDGMKPSDANVLHRQQYTQQLNVPTVVHVHLPIVRDVSRDVQFFSSWFEQTWFMNLGTKRSLPVQILLLFCNFFKTVIPIRDPLAAILSREARHPQFRHFFIVDGFVALATEFARHPNVKFLPIDLYKDEEQRKALLSDTLIHCSIDPAHHCELLNRMAREWPIENPTPGNKFRELYESGDIDEIRRLLGPKWAEVEYLKNMASIILPFLAKIGYTKSDLNLW